MAGAGYYIHKSVDDWEAVGRWENEGGRFRPHHDLSLDSTGEGFLRRREQATSIGKLGEPDDSAHAMSLLAPDGAKYIKVEEVLYRPEAGGDRHL